MFSGYTSPLFLSFLDQYLILRWNVLLSYLPNLMQVFFSIFFIEKMLLLFPATPFCNGLLDSLAAIISPIPRQWRVWLASSLPPPLFHQFSLHLFLFTAIISVHSAENNYFHINKILFFFKFSLTPIKQYILDNCGLNIPFLFKNKVFIYSFFLACKNHTCHIIYETLDVALKSFGRGW